jgi:starch phosphorylase
MHLADLTSYAQAQQRDGELYANSAEWAGKAIINVALSGRFSSDRTIAEYAADIWRAEPCPVADGDSILSSTFPNAKGKRP